jgi:hypothetical protein
MAEVLGEFDIATARPPLYRRTVDHSTGQFGDGRVEKRWGGAIYVRFWRAADRPQAGVAAPCEGPE